jgi:hypothetical protein
MTMSTRTIIEINHDHLNAVTKAELIDLVEMLGSSTVTGLLNKNGGEPVTWTSGVRILAQRHHSETLNLEVKS